MEYHLREYHMRAWCTYESLISRWLKTRREDLWDPIIIVPPPQEKTGTKASADSGGGGGGGGGGKGGALTTKQVAPPMDFETFRDYLGRLETGTPTDKDLLLELYDRTLKRAFSHVEVCIHTIADTCTHTA